MQQTSSDSEAAVAGPLAGLRVLDLTRAVSGPLCSMVLADLGADVVKVELPTVGDTSRQWGPPYQDGVGPSFLAHNRNKRSIALDLRVASERQRLEPLLHGADVMVENFRPGTLNRFGLAVDVLLEAHPKLIICSISGYGQRGPMSRFPAMDLLMQAASGLMSLTGDPEGEPVKAAAPVADVISGLVGAISIMGAVRLRESDGRGRYLDVSMLDGMMTLLGQALTTYTMSETPPRRLGNGHALLAPYQSFRTVTNDITLQVTTDDKWNLLAGMEEFAPTVDLERFGSRQGRSEGRTELCDLLQEVFLKYPSEHWLDRFQSLGLAAAPVRSLAQAVSDFSAANPDTFMDVDYPPGSGRTVRIPGMPWRDVAAKRPVSDPPLVDQNADEIWNDPKWVGGAPE